MSSPDSVAVRKRKKKYKLTISFIRAYIAKEIGISVYLFGLDKIIYDFYRKCSFGAQERIKIVTCDHNSFRCDYCFITFCGSHKENRVCRFEKCDIAECKQHISKSAKLAICTLCKEDVCHKHYTILCLNRVRVICDKCI